MRMNNLVYLSCLHFSCSLFLVQSTIRYGNCFTFNHKLNLARDPSAGNRHLAISGNNHGLQLVINLDQNQYIKTGLTQSEGLRAAVIDPTIMIQPEAFGVNMQPNTMTSLALQNIKISRMETPYTSNCTRSWKNSSYPGFDEAEYSLLVNIEILLQTVSR